MLRVISYEVSLDRRRRIYKGLKKMGEEKSSYVDLL